MHRVGDQLAELAPALAFLLAAVPLATLLDRLGFFRAAAARLTGPHGTSVLALWLLAAATTVVLNLDTTIVLLTPLYVRIAPPRRRRPAGARAGAAPAREPRVVGAAGVEPHEPGRRRARRPHRRPRSSRTSACRPSPRWPSGGGATPAGTPHGWTRPRRATWCDRRALRVGGTVVAAVLVGFVLGPPVGIAPWMTALVADVVLVALTRHVPWRDLPVLTAAGVAAIGALVALLVPGRRARAAAAPHPSRSRSPGPRDWRPSPRTW